jgi:hypothetical protein
MLIRTKLNKKNSTVTASPVGRFAVIETTTTTISTNYSAIKPMHRCAARQAAHRDAVQAWVNERNTDLIVHIAQAGPAVCYWIVGHKALPLEPIGI